MIHKLNHNEFLALICNVDAEVSITQQCIKAA